MRIIFLFLMVTALVGLLLGTVINIDSGYVLLSWDVYTLETSLWFFLMSLALACSATYILIRASLLLLGSDWRFNEWRRERRRNRSRYSPSNSGLARCTCRNHALRGIRAAGKNS